MQLYTRVCFPPASTSSQTEMETFLVPTDDEPDPELILQSESFQQDLFVMERIVLENIYQPKLAAYRQLPILEGETVSTLTAETNTDHTHRKYY